MNKDQVKGAVKEAAGKVQRKISEVMGRAGQQAKGATKEAEGKAEKRSTMQGTLRVHSAKFIAPELIEAP